ncbi:syncytin-1-like [Lynx rufus]|uniref:syncytin-1-like n=1 Tax=Lynx rufus TaxID=61384 RepID=UPI001F1233E9|nr:syncytin-1-like [Lynx rufus]
MHSSCYDSYQQCIGPDNSTTYFTAILQSVRAAKANDNNMQLQAGCRGSVGEAVCWNPRAPIHVSDGGGPQDTVRQIETQAKLKEIAKHMYPQLNYHPLIFTRHDPYELDPQTMSILEATFSLLNISNPSLAQDCWLCLPRRTPRPIAIPTEINISITNDCLPSSLLDPFPVQFISPFNASCFKNNLTSQNDNIDVGIVSLAQCHQYIIINSSLCSTNTTVFVCGNNQAYTYLPHNWTGVCILATLLPDIDLVTGKTPMPIPSLDFVAGRSKRAVAVIPLLAGLGITGALAAGTAGLGVSIHSYLRLSRRLINDVEALSGTIQDLQDQLDSLAEVVLQNRRGLDLLTVEQGGICLALQEKCCFYANKSGIVRTKIKQLQEDLARRRKELAENPLWSALHGFLPYLLPLLGPLLSLLLLFTVGPIIFNKIMNFIRDRLNTIQVMVLRPQYQLLDMESELN